MADEKDPSSGAIEVKLNFRMPARMPSVYAHHMLVQEGLNEVLLSFFEIVAPLVIEEPTGERLKAMLEAGVAAECVAKVTVAKASFPSFAAALQKVAVRLSNPKAEEAQDAEAADANNKRDNPES